MGVITKLKEGEKEKEGEWKKLYSFYKEDVRERASKLYNGFSSFYKAELGRGGGVERVFSIRSRDTYEIFMGLHEFTPFGYSESKVGGQGISVGVSPPHGKSCFREGMQIVDSARSVAKSNFR